MTKIHEKLDESLSLELGFKLYCQLQHRMIDYTIYRQPLIEFLMLILSAYLAHMRILDNQGVVTSD